MQDSTPVYCNLEEMKQRKGAPPSPTCSPVHIGENWEYHVDPNTGRNFFINIETREKTWKPPRRSKTPGRVSVFLASIFTKKLQMMIVIHVLLLCYLGTQVISCGD